MNLRQRWRGGQPTTVLAATGYLLLLIAIVLPYGRNLGQRLIGNNIDDWIFYWNNWWIREAITHNWDWLYTHYLFYPTGTTLASHSNSFLTSLLAYPLQPLVGPIAAYNLVLLAGLWLGAWGMFLLVKELTRNSAAAFLAGLVFAFAPYHLTQVLAHAHLGSIHWWPFFALFLHRSLVGRRWLDVLAAGFFAALTLWSGLQLAVLLALWSLFYLPWRLWQLRPKKREHWPGFTTHTLSRLAVMGLLALVLSWPVVWPTLRAEPDLAQKASGFDEDEKTQTDLLAYGLPPTYHPLWGKLVEPVYENFVSNRSFMPYLGYGVAGLALLAIIGRRRESLFWSVSGGVWLLLSAGGSPRINGVVYGAIPLPYRWLGSQFPISAVRSADRFNLLLVFSAAVLVGFGAAWLLQRKRWLAVLLGGIIALEYMVFPLPAWEAMPDSQFLAQLAADPSTEAVLDYPMGTQPSKLWLYYQTVHGKPMVEGYVGRYGRQTFAYINANPFLQTLRQPEAPEEPLPISDLGPQLRRLRADGIRYLLVHLSFAEAEDLAYFQRALPALIPVYEDENLVVYDLGAPRPWHYGDAPLKLGGTADLIQATASLEESALHISLISELAAQYKGPLTCQVQLPLGEETAAVPLNLFNEEADWQPGDLTAKEVVLPLPNELPPGNYSWQITCPDSPPAVSPDHLVVGENGHLTLLRSLDNVTFGDNIKLEGHRWWTTGSTLQIALQWQALADIDQDYKVFVHLLDETGALVSQFDAITCNWTCPSSDWLAGETFDGSANLSLMGLPPGSYRLAIGLYGSNSGTRLPVKNENGTPFNDDFYVVDDVIQINAN